MKRIKLEFLPTSLCYDEQIRNLLVGLEDGWIICYSQKWKEIYRQRNFNDGAVVGLKISQNSDQKKIIAVEKKAMTVYKYRTSLL